MRKDWPPGLMGFRDLRDVEQMQAACRTGAGHDGNALVIGGGLLGLEGRRGPAQGWP